MAGSDRVPICILYQPRELSIVLQENVAKIQAGHSLLECYETQNQRGKFESVTYNKATLLLSKSNPKRVKCIF